MAALGLAQPAPPKFRLGREVKPVRYAVDLRVVPTGESFSGKVAIELDVKQAVPVIWLNGKQLEVTEAAVQTTSGRMAAKVIPVAEGEFLGFEFPNPVPAGKATLTASYKGKLNAKSSDGVFKNQDLGEWYAFTQFEATEARSAFPCFDEPGFKTPWQLTLHVKKEHSAFSNTMPVRTLDEAGGMQAVKFAETKPLPSYLVAFAVGPFETVDAGKAGRKNTPLRIIVPKGRTAEAKWAVESTGPILKLLEDYFNIPYPYNKLDSIAVPLFGGAMENPGLITYSLPLIIAKPDDDTVNRQRGYATVAAHEIAHMWFGDLVTMAWWDDLWLNESFATWMGDRATAQFRPEWDWTTTTTSGRLGAMNADSLVTARKIRQPIQSRHDIANAFDGITYGKGGAVIHMFEQWLGPETLRRGVKSYLDRNAWGNATAGDFLQALSTAAGRDVTPVFSTYLEQPGVPVLTVDMKCGGEGKTPSLQVSQKRYLPMGSKAPAEQTWQIPMCFEYGLGGQAVKQCTLITQAAATIPLEKAKACPDWVLLNDEYAGYYRTLYRGGTLNNLLANASHLNASERLGLIRDTEALVRSGDLMPGEALGLVPKFAGDENRQVVGATVGAVAGLRSHLVPEELQPNYARFIQRTYGERARQLGWTEKPGEPDDTKLLRQSIVPLVANYGDDAELRAQGAALGRKWLDDRKVVPPGMSEAALGVAARTGDLALWERMLAEARKTREEQERSDILRAMGAFRSPEIIARNFDLLVSGQFDMRQSLALLLSPVRYPETCELPFNYVKTHYDEISAKMSGGMGFDYRAILPNVGSGFCTPEKRAEVEQFFKPKAEKITGAPRMLQQTLERIEQCNATRIAQQGAVAEFLKKY
ncbi:MAG TPA: M1 family metallopeptidase [Bryobacteraceae bacterium]|nr:M1 family metallopeptidase [Bryobacteraceae bacterium]